MFMMHLTIGDFDSLKQRHDSAAFNLSRLNDNLKRMKAIYEESSSDLKEQLTKILIPMMNTVEESLVMVEYMNCIRTKLNSGPCRVEINVIKIEDEVKESK